MDNTDMSRHRFWCEARFNGYLQEFKLKARNPKKEDLMKMKRS
jgi:hypothetical protein